ncbi:MAG TPA: hypothetical protein VGH43_15970 [Jatrophihabitans sp.]
MTATTATRSRADVRRNQVTILTWVVAVAMVIAVAAMVIALVALTNRRAEPTHGPGASVQSTQTGGELCFPTHIVHPC